MAARRGQPRPPRRTREQVRADFARGNEAVLGRDARQNPHIDPTEYRAALRPAREVQPPEVCRWCNGWEATWELAPEKDFRTLLEREADAGFWP